MQGMQELFRTPLQRVFGCPDRRFAMRKGCSALERTDAFLDSMPLSAESAQSRPFMAEGFLAMVQRIEERWGPEATSGRFATPVQPESAWQDASSSLTRACAMDTPDTFAAVVSTECTRPLPASAPMCALHPKCQLLPFLDWCASGPRAVPALRGARRPDGGGIHDGAAPHHDPRLLGLGIGIAEHGPAGPLPPEGMAELRGGRRVRHLLPHEAEAHGALHRPRIQDGILCPPVGKAGHRLEQAHPEHRLRAAHMPAARLGMAAGLHQGAPPVPWHDRVHPPEELLPPGLPPLPLRLQVPEAHLAAHACLPATLPCMLLL